MKMEKEEAIGDFRNSSNDFILKFLKQLCLEIFVTTLGTTKTVWK